MPVPVWGAGTAGKGAASSNMPMRAGLGAYQLESRPKPEPQQPPMGAYPEAYAANYPARQQAMSQRSSGGVSRESTRGHEHAYRNPNFSSRGSPSSYGCFDDGPRPLKLKAHVGCRDVEVPEIVAQDGSRYVVIEMKGCDRGPPLLPVESKWCTPEDCTTPLLAYLVNLAQRSGGTIEGVDKIDGYSFPRYQCAVRADHWKHVWETIHAVFLSMRSMYRYIRGGKNAPNLWFGMAPRFLEKRTSSTSRDGRKTRPEKLGEMPPLPPSLQGGYPEEMRSVRSVPPPPYEEDYPVPPPPPYL